MRGLSSVILVILVAVAVVQVAVASKCPPQNGVDVTLLPNPANCKTYFLCQAGHPFLMYCPDGLYFNPDLRVCDWTIRDEKDHCLIRPPPSSSSQPGTSPTTPQPTTPQPTTPQQSSPQPTTLQPTSPPSPVYNDIEEDSRSE